MLQSRVPGQDTFRCGPASVLLLAAAALFSFAGCQSLPGVRDLSLFRGQSPDSVVAIGDEETRPEFDDAIADIIVEGNQTIETGAILAHVKSQSGRPADERQIKDDLRALYATRWFYSVERRYRMTDEGLILVFRVIERPVVRSIVVKGNRSFSTRQILKQITLEEGSPYDVATNRSAAKKIERFYHDGKSYPLATVALEKGGDPDDRDVVFVIDEGPYTVVRNTEFEGNENIQSGLLRLKLKSKRTMLGWLANISPFGAMFGGKYDEGTLPADVAALKEYYHNLGYFDVTVEKNVETDDGHIVPQIRLVKSPFKKIKYEHLPIPYIRLRRSRGITYHYVIDEGPRYRVRNIEVEGNQVFDQQQLLAESKLRTGDEFNARWLNKDVQDIREKYGQRGHLFAQINAVPRFLEGEGNTVDVVYQIQEDRPYTIRRINVHIDAPGGNPHTRETVVLNTIKVAPGELADPQNIELSKGRLGGPVFERGGQQAPRIQISRVDDKKSPVASAIARGQNSPQRETVVLNTIKVAPGKLADPRDSEVSRSGPGNSVFERGEAAAPRIQNQKSNVAEKPWPQTSAITRGQNPIEGQQNPYNPIFENKNAGDPYGGLTGPYGDALTRPGQVDLDIFATEAQTGRLMFGVGVNSNAGVLGSFVLEENNFDITRVPTSWRDLADGTAFRGNGERFRLEAVPGQYVSRYSASWQTSNFLDTNYSGGVSGFYYQRFMPDWNEHRIGGRLTLGKQIDKWWSLTSALRLEDVSILNVNNPTGVLAPDAAKVLGQNFLSTARVSLVNDTRNSAFLPSEGHMVELAYEQAFGNYLYPRFEVQGTQYFTTYEQPDGTGRHIFSLHGEYDWTDSDTPMFERYFAGGYQSFRGFSYRGISPQQNGIGVGGDVMILSSAEYSIPLTADEMIRVVGFVDAGTVETSPRTISASTFRVTAGFGLRLTIPAMGPAPLAFDFGFPISKEPYDNTRLFSFYIGLTR
ncbi:BamA/TamA family outer membrane protein [bacterium]|nr:BamA/TamA family outer membrane protein [bacterium]